MNSLFDAINRYWSETEQAPLPPVATALFHLLCHLANRHHWQMPVKCSTAMLAYHLRSSRQRVCSARAVLSELGFISFSDGTNQSKPAEYTILCAQTASKQKFTQKLTPDVTPQLTQELTHYKECKNKEKSSHTTREELHSLVDLEKTLVADTEWQQSVISFIASHLHQALDCQQLRDHLHQFFQYLSAKGTIEREDEDTRAYFCSWLKILLTNKAKKSYATNNTSVSPAANRRPVDINASEKKNYNTSF